MSTTLSPTLLVSLLVSGLIYLFFLFKQGKLAGLKFQSIGSEGKAFGITILSMGVILALRAFFSPADTPNSLFMFLLALNVPFFLRHFNFTPAASQLILLFLAVLLSSVFANAMSETALLSVLLGLLINKVLENLIFSPGNRLDDVAPACAWLAVQAWLSLTGNSNPNVGNILLSCLSISLLLKLTPATLITNDSLFAKRAVLAASGGLALLIILNQVLLAPKMAALAALFAFSIFFAYYFANEASGEEDIDRLSHCLKFLVVLGAITLAATRLFGDLGFVVLVPCSLLCGPSNNVILASIFWCSRLLVQAFVATNVANVTGINLMHVYCSAALYFGFLAILFLLAILGINTKKWLAPTALLLTSIVLSPVIIYLFHEEAAASFLIASLVSAVSLVSFFPFLYKGKDAVAQDNLMLAPLIMTTIGLLYGPLATIGNEATVASRMQLVSEVTGAFFLIYLIFLVVNRSRGSRKPVSVSGDKS